MGLLYQLIRSAMIYLVVIVGLVLIVLFPRHTAVHVANNGAMTITPGYEFSASEYKYNIEKFVQTLREDHSLGETKFATLTVEDELKKYFPRSIKIILISFCLSLIGGIAKGIFDFKNARTKKNVLGNGTTWLFQSIPDFFLIACVLWLIFFYMPFYNAFGYGRWYSFILPSILVAIYPMMYIARITSASLAGQEGQPYVQVAFSKGFTRNLVLYKHMLRVSFGTIFSHTTSLMIYLLSNLLVVEYLVGYEGLAYRLFISIGFSNTVNLAPPSYEPGLIIGIGICFLLMIMLAQIVGSIAKRYAEVD